MKALLRHREKAPIARFLADKVAAVFVPAVLLISVIAFVVTWWIKGDWVTALIRHSVALCWLSFVPCALEHHSCAIMDLVWEKRVNV